MTNILHLTAHMGGGVGKALYGLVEQSSISGSEFKHDIVCLEKPIKVEFINKILKYNKEIIIEPTIDELENLMKKADIVQLEWWNHPSTIKYLCSISEIPIRLLTWCHNSGLFNPKIPKELIYKSHMFLFTTECSLHTKEIKELIKNPEIKDKIEVVYSSGGFSEFPEPEIKDIPDKISIGYIGSLKSSKIHPNYVNYISQLNGIKIKIIGDLSNQHNIDVMNSLKNRCEKIDKPDLLEFTGYVKDVTLELKTINVLAYLLNPEHYGTTENALLEAMSMGIVPVVLDNPAEQCIVDGNTGFTIDSPEEFLKVIKWLDKNPEHRQKMGQNASKYVREKFSVGKTENQLNYYYNKILSTNKKTIDFKKVLNNTCQDY